MLTADNQSLCLQYVQIMQHNLLRTKTIFSVSFVPVRSSVPQKQSETVEYVIVIHDDDDADQLPVQRGSVLHLGLLWNNANSTR